MARHTDHMNAVAVEVVPSLTSPATAFVIEREARDMGSSWSAEDWAKRQPHSFYSHWPVALMTKCDYCGVYKKDHAPDVPKNMDVACYPSKAVKGGIDPSSWPVR